MVNTVNEMTRGQKAAATRAANKLAAEKAARKLAKAAKAESVDTSGMTRGQKAAATRLKNERKAKFTARANLAWETRRRNAKKAGLLTRSGKPTEAEIARRKETAAKAWETRVAKYGETGRSTSAPTTEVMVSASA